MVDLFKSSKGIVTDTDLFNALESVKASECDVLYIHTDMTFGLPMQKRKQTLDCLYRIIERLNVKTLVFPTFTFSFCNNENYDSLNTPTKMGALNEYVRKNIKGTRTEDPLLSVFVVGEKLNLCDNLGVFSIGLDSNYDRLHKCGKNVKFLFFGADMKQCFTYTHYMEAIYKVPYRYDREFSGSYTDNSSVVHKNAKFKLYSTYGNSILNPVPVVFNAMKQKNQLNIADVGDSSITCFSEKDAYETISELLEKNIFCLTDGTFKESEKNEIYNKDNTYVLSVR